MNVQRKAPKRWEQNPAHYRTIHCPDMSCGAPLRVPTPPTVEPTAVTCEGTWRHTWSHSALIPKGATA